MNRLILISTIFLAFVFFVRNPKALADEGKLTFGAEAGEVGLSQDVGSTYGNALGAGAFFTYAPSDFLDFQLSWLTSHHTSNNLNLVQNAYIADLIYKVDQFDIFTPYIEGGAEFVGHTQDVLNTSTGTTSSSSNTGFGLNIGFGAKVDLGKNFQTG